MKCNPNDLAFPRPEANGIVAADGLTKREYFAGLAMHAEFLSCGSNKESAEALMDAAGANNQSLGQRMAINALAVADALIAELNREAAK